MRGSIALCSPCDTSPSHATESRGDVELVEIHEESIRRSWAPVSFYMRSWAGGHRPLWFELACVSTPEQARKTAQDLPPSTRYTGDRHSGGGLHVGTYGNARRYIGTRAGHADALLRALHRRPTGGRGSGPADPVRGLAEVAHAAQPAGPGGLAAGHGAQRVP